MVDKGLALQTAAILITLLAGFGAVMRKLGRLEQKMDIVWEWFTNEVLDQRPNGRRRTDAATVRGD